ncbi:UNVERIFIED_CONTAM: hypothetical protein Sangu_2765400 [Sesamum angustifolium]|uniref:Reverse transcriptase/retrotransposon-derived protein RNase H-like domain-containing protein n=1 Tax=Sesamum angustifolium TaxID=2727405 RepID=A0AAW2IUB0_9LAMI
MNPSICAFGVTSGKCLAFIVRQRGIEIEQAKIDVILTMPKPRNIHELKSLDGKLTYLRRFISNLAGHCQLFSRLMKKDVPFQWNEACDKAFKSIKSCLMKPPVLVAPVPGCPLILYVAAQKRSVGILLAQKNDEGKENALYYLSRTMKPNELKYSPIEKLCLTLIFSIQKLKHYIQSHSIHLVLKANPLKYVMAKPFLQRLWSGLLVKISITPVDFLSSIEDDVYLILESMTSFHKLDVSKVEKLLNTFFVKVCAYDEARSLSSKKLSPILHEQQLKEVKAHLQDVEAKASKEASEIQSAMDKLEHIEKEIVVLKGRRTSLRATLKWKKQLNHDTQAKVHEVKKDIATLESTGPLDDAIVENLESSSASLEILKEDLKSLNSFA